MAIEEQKAEMSWEEAVSRFLQENPDYFSRNPRLLAQMEIPHPDTGNAVSLIERQVLALRKDNQALETQLRQLVDNATENDALAGQLHQFTVELMLATTIAEIVSLVTDSLQSRFKLDLVVLKLLDSQVGDAVSSEYAISTDDPVIKKIIKKVRSGQSECGIKLGADEAKALLDDKPVPTGSLALIPVKLDTNPLGLLVLGSNDEYRFVTDMATTYLDRIGELIAVAVKNQT